MHTNVIKIVKHSQAPGTPLIRQRLGEVRRARRARSADAHADEDPRNDEHSDVLAGGLQHGREDREERSVQHGVFPSDRVGDLAVEDAGDGAAEPDGRGVEREGGGREGEVVGVGGEDVECVTAAVSFDSKRGGDEDVQHRTIITHGLEIVSSFLRSSSRATYRCH